MPCVDLQNCPNANNDWHHAAGCPGNVQCYAQLTQGANMTQVWIQQNITNGQPLGGGNTTWLENWQRCTLESIINACVPKSDHLRFNVINATLQPMRQFHDQTQPFAWTEDFDGMFIRNGQRYLVNFKFTNNGGGQQNRTMRELYHYIRTQVDYLNNNPDCDDIILNILDGDALSPNIQHFQLILNGLDQGIAGQIFIGDTYTLQQNWPNI